MDESGIPNPRTLLVGNNKNDKEAARRLGIDYCRACPLFSHMSAGCDQGNAGVGLWYEQMEHKIERPGHERTINAPEFLQ